MAKNILSGQRSLLQAIADGGRPWVARNQRTGEEEWWLEQDKQPALRILVSTARAAVKEKYIEPTGFLYWSLTDAGRAELAKRLP